MKHVQIWLGHHSPAFTLGVYVHLIPDDLPDADVFAVPTGNGGATEPGETRHEEGDVDAAESPIAPSLVLGRLGG